MMATKIYETANITLVDGTELYITPLKLKYLRDFMDKIDILKKLNNEDHLIGMCECVRVAMKQYYPLIKTIEDVENSVDLKTLYKIIKIASGIDFDPDSVQETEENSGSQNNKTTEISENGWNTFDLAKLESEVFLLGIWKNYEELEESMSLPEISALLESKREIDFNDKKFFASIQGVDLDAGNAEPDAWEKLKARVASRGQTENPNDILSFQGVKAEQAGFGIGMGLDYELVQ